MRKIGGGGGHTHLPSAAGGKVLLALSSEGRVEKESDVTRKSKTRKDSNPRQIDFTTKIPPESDKQKKLFHFHRREEGQERVRWRLRGRRKTKVLCMYAPHHVSWQFPPIGTIEVCGVEGGGMKGAVPTWPRIETPLHPNPVLVGTFTFRK